MQTIDVVSKDLKFINDINQVVKKVYLRYMVVRNGVVFATKDDIALKNGGQHFSFIGSIERLREYIPIPEMHVLSLDSAAIYTTIRDFKKHITQIKISDVNQVSFVTEETEFPIGEIRPIGDDVMELYTNATTQATLKGDYRVGEPMIASMVKNEIVTVESDGFKFRMTKALFPHIKTGIPIYLRFIDTDNPSLFTVLIAIDKDNITNFHQYTCVRF